jgi:7-cyano-7-deazaguanine tRNA-ribosyltransferase
MFALSVFLGCDTFDSAAYVLMAKDGRYLTVDGTLQLESIDEFPCSCKICVNYTVKEVKQQSKSERTRILSEHNLWESMAEIRRIRQAIKMGRLWDLVQQRASSVPRLGRATRMASDFVTSGRLSKLYQQGTPVSHGYAPKVTKPVDLIKFDYTKIRNISKELILSNPKSHVIVFCYTMRDSIFNKLVDKQLKDTLKSHSEYQLLLFLPPLGILPLGLNEMFPVAQLIHDLELDQFSLKEELEILEKLSQLSKRVDIILADEWPEAIITKMTRLNSNVHIHMDDKPLTALRKIVTDYTD